MSSALGEATATAPNKRKTGWRVTLNRVPCTGADAASASDVGTPRSVLSKVRAQPLTVRANVIRPARAIERVTDLPEKKRARRNGAPPKPSTFTSRGQPAEPRRRPDQKFH